MDLSPSHASIGKLGAHALPLDPQGLALLKGEVGEDHAEVAQLLQQLGQAG